MKTIAITGSAGFVGKYLLEQLHGRNDIKIIELDIVNGYDICNWEQIKDVKADIYVHLANKSFVPDSYENPHSFYNVNVNSTLNILELARINKAKVIYFSSYVYGAPQYLPINEEHPICAFNPYATTKVMCEEMCRGYARDFKLPIIVFRPFNIYGVGQSPNFLLPMMIKQLKSAKVVVHDDRPKRDYIHVVDVVNAIICAINSDFNSYDTINIGTGVSYSVKEVADMLIKLYGRNVSFESLEKYRPSEVLETIADVSKLNKLGWKQTISLEQGLKMMIDNENINSL